MGLKVVEARQQEERNITGVSKSGLSLRRGSPLYSMHPLAETLTLEKVPDELASIDLAIWRSEHITANIDGRARPLVAHPLDGIQLHSATPVAPDVLNLRN